MSRSCETCRFAELTIEGDDPRVECRRFPPNVVALPDDQSMAGQLWPVVQVGDWCGEYRSTEEGRTEP